MKLENLTHFEIKSISGGHNGTLFRIGVAVGEFLGLAAVYANGFLQVMGLGESKKK
jgi:hypothetical protein